MTSRINHLDISHLIPRTRTAQCGGQLRAAGTKDPLSYQCDGKLAREFPVIFWPGMSAGRNGALHFWYMIQLSHEKRIPSGLRLNTSDAVGGLLRVGGFVPSKTHASKVAIEPRCRKAKQAWRYRQRGRVVSFGAAARRASSYELSAISQREGRLAACGIAACH